MSKYSEKLKDPRWQKLRLKVLERDEWSCFQCGEKELMLSVHHLYYMSGKEPWEYSKEDLITLCENCHTEEYEMRKDYEDDLLLILRQKRAMCADLGTIIQCINNLNIEEIQIRLYGDDK